MSSNRFNGYHGLLSEEYCSCIDVDSDREFTSFRHARMRATFDTDAHRTPRMACVRHFVTRLNAAMEPAASSVPTNAEYRAITGSRKTPQGQGRTARIATAPVMSGSRSQPKDGLDL
ncbi:MAG: hypothetical protein CMJ36_02750 [Phycisphaerae bacterium]|nr:hypothetical protein [Phycisphaerae bacterium]